MKPQEISRFSKPVKIYLVITALTGLGLGLSDSVFANYFSDAYNITASTRGMIEFPRELPGILCVILVSLLAFWGDVKLAMLAQALSAVGIAALGMWSPEFSVMIYFLFINSLGMHLYMPIGDSIGLKLVDNERYGSSMGMYNGIRTASVCASGILVFIGFRKGFFSFLTPIKPIFLISAATFAAVFILYIPLLRIIKPDYRSKRIPGIIIRKEYIIYYIICALYGARKQIMYVFGPWVLITLMGFETATMGMLTVAGAFVGIFFMPLVGRLIDRFTVRNVMMAEALLFFAVYLCYGLVSAGLDSGTIEAAGFWVSFMLALNVIDKMAAQFAMVRPVFLREVAIKDSDITPSLSTGISIDHIVSIACAALCGTLWDSFGPQYVFVFAGFISILNMLVAWKIKKRT